MNYLDLIVLMLGLWLLVPTMGLLKLYSKKWMCLRENGIPYSHLLAFNSDTCNTMKGQRKGVASHLLKQQPNIIDFCCICHLENLAIKAAMKTLPTSIDDFLVEIHNHFYLSMERKEELQSCCNCGPQLLASLEICGHKMAESSSCYRQSVGDVGCSWILLQKPSWCKKKPGKVKRT